jgi:glucose uptake protein GlcU
MTIGFECLVCMIIGVLAMAFILAPVITRSIEEEKDEKNNKAGRA